MRLVAVALMVAGMALVASCGQDPVAGPPDNGVERDEGPDDAQDEQVLEGTLAGDPQLEGGCAWLDTGDGRFDVQYPGGYEIAFEPVRLQDPDGDVIASEGDTVRVRGRVAEDVMTICQVGTVFRASEVVSE